MGYDDAAHRVVNDWTWSVGNTPHAITSTEMHFSAFHIDQVRRQQVVLMLEEILSIYNTAVARLSLPVDQSNLAFLVSQNHTANNLRAVQAILTNSLQTISAAMGVLDFELAMEECWRLYPLMTAFITNATNLASDSAKASCDTTASAHAAHLATSTSDGPYLMLLIIANCVALIAVVLTKDKASRRVKID